MDSLDTGKEPDHAARKAKRIYDNFNSRTFKLYCLVFKAVIPVFDAANQLLQNEKPCIHILHDVLQRLLESILVRFVKPSVIKGPVAKVNFKDREIQKEDEDLSIGVEAKKFTRETPVSTQSRSTELRGITFVPYALTCAKLFRLMTKSYRIHELQT